ncbi:MAG: undecaprenyl-diphosphate phosphatase [Gammaproteobacteria bacterium]|nr:MAG: undecaprenyl-diphosphate phosphatase [Gammaproteobacteria bacterium]
MSTFDIIILALIQGLTEFLPISSSAHLILPSQILGWDDQGLAFDVAVHVGTLMAVVLYYRSLLGKMLLAWFGSLSSIAKPQTVQQNFDATLSWWILFATIPAALFGFLAKDFIEQYLRTALVISAMTLLFGFFLGYADVIAGKRTQNEEKPLEKLGFKGAMIIGFAQMVALIPGTSRSGITMTLGLMLGLSRLNAANFSFLLSIPIIAMAGGYYSLQLFTSATIVDWYAMILGIAVSFSSAFACIHYFLILVEKLGMMPFVIYRLFLGVGLLWFVLS